jgi:hypothetical protein
MGSHHESGGLSPVFGLLGAKRRQCCVPSVVKNEQDPFSSWNPTAHLRMKDSDGYDLFYGTENIPGVCARLSTDVDQVEIRIG